MPAGGNFHFKAFPHRFVGPVAYIGQQLRIQRQIRWNWRWQVSVQVLLSGWSSETSSGENPNERTETQNVSSSKISQEFRGHLKSAQDLLGSAHAEDGYHQQLQLFRRHVSPENSWVWYMQFKKIIFRWFWQELTNYDYAVQELEDPCSPCQDDTQAVWF